MAREIRKIRTPLGEVRVKISTFGEIQKAMPEYEDMKMLAQKSGHSLMDIQQMVLKSLDGLHS